MPDNTSFLDLPPELKNALSGGWVQDNTGSRFSGKPQTVEAQDYVINSLKNKGVLPTASELARFQQTGTYDPTSTMGKMGFTDYQQYVDAQRYGETYGPNSGALVPEGGTVVTDEYGRPQYRFMGQDRIPQGYLDKGQFIGEGGITPESPLWAGPDVGMDAYYPQYDRTAFRNPTMEEALGNYSPPQEYQARLQDYLTGRVSKDQAEIDKINNWADQREQELQNLLSAGQITEADYNKALQDAQDIYNSSVSRYMTGDIAKTVRTEAERLIGQGMSPEQAHAELLKKYDIGTERPEIGQVPPGEMPAVEQFQSPPITRIPGLEDIMGTTGANVQGLYNAMLENQKGIYQNRMDNTPEWQGYQENDPVNATQGEFLTYTEQLGLAPEYKQWLGNQYFSLLEQWQKNYSGQMNFLDFVQQYLSSGGKI